MIISEKQIMQLIQIAHIYLNALETLTKIDKILFTNCGQHNKENIAKILMQIANQQSEELKVID